LRDGCHTVPMSIGTSWSRPTRLVVVMGLNLALVSALVVVGVKAHSLGVFAEGGDYLADAAAIGVSLLAIWLSERPPTPTRPHGYPKATAWAALVNGGWLLLLTALVSAAAINRLVSGTTEVHGLPVLLISSLAGLVMVVGALILSGDDDDDDDHGGKLNMRAVLLDTTADAAAAITVALSGAIILATGGNYWLDPTVALVLAAVIAYHAIKLLHGVIVTLRSKLDDLLAKGRRGRPSRRTPSRRSRSIKSPSASACAPIIQAGCPDLRR
jgi:cobalt-zinc-cadmium efflux system protein